MNRFTVSMALCAVALCAGSVAADEGEQWEKGYKMATKAVRGICWYEFLKIKPGKVVEKTGAKYNNCFKNMDMEDTVADFVRQGVARTDYATIKGSLPGSMDGFLKDYVPANYYSACTGYMTDPEKGFSKDYSSVLGDGSEPYMFRGFAHCMMAELDKRKGMDALKEKWNSPSQPWVNEIFNRENDHRQRHGAPAVTLNDELNARAQRWADQLVAKCPTTLTIAEHIQEDNPDATYEGKQSGENIAQLPNPGLVPDEDQAIAAANNWYAEIRDYPWPEYKGKGDDQQFLKIGHFTSSVWAGVQQVGYGLGRREGCDKLYIVGRYWPGGNMPGKFGENVLPVQS